jgi:hypothetical protein
LRAGLSQLRGMNMLPVGGAPAEVRRFIHEETERRGEVIRSANIELQ